jgi:hypothetical protein
MTKRSSQSKATQLHPLAHPQRRWGSVSIDFVSGLEMTARGMDAIMSVTDRSTKMVHLVPLSSKGSNAATVARLFVDNVWRLHGMPSVVSRRTHTVVGWRRPLTSPALVRDVGASVNSIVHN